MMPDVATHSDPALVVERSLRAHDPVDRPKFVLLSSSLMTDRMFRYTRALERLQEHAEVEIWAASMRTDYGRRAWDSVGALVRPFPEVEPFREFPHNLLRRMNEFAWDDRLRSPSRISAERHCRQNRAAIVRSLRWPAKVIAQLGLEGLLETRLEKLLRGYPRSPETDQLLDRGRPDLVLTTNPFWFLEPGVAAAASNRGIPTVALIPSWDNITTKPRLVFSYDGYLVWSEQQKGELQAYYPKSRSVPIYVIGAPQFDIFQQPRFHDSREAFCARIGLDPRKPIILYVLGSPNFLSEHHGACAFARRMVEGALGDAQMIVRPHPIHDNGRLRDLFKEFGPRIVLQGTQQSSIPTNERCQTEDDVRDWVNTFRHADVVVNLASTSTIDAALFDRPVVNLDFDPEPGQPKQQLVKDVNHVWCHFKPVAESGGVWLVNNIDELIRAVRTYLEHPELHRSNRRSMSASVCGFIDGRCGERLADALLDFSKNHASRGRFKG